MLIQCTKKLLDQLNIDFEEQPQEESLFSWHANLITVYRRKVIVLVNDKNRYVIIVSGLKDKDFKRLDELIIKAIKETLKAEGIKQEFIEKFINHSKGIIYTKTKNPSAIAKMNKACEILEYHEELLEDEAICNVAMSIKANQYSMSDGKSSFIYPNEEMYKDLESFAGEPISWI